MILSHNVWFGFILIQWLLLFQYRKKGKTKKSNSPETPSTDPTTPATPYDVMIGARCSDIQTLGKEFFMFFDGVTMCLRWDSYVLLKTKLSSVIIIPPCFNEVERGIYCPSVCGQNRVRSVSSTILAESISYLHILSSNFRRCFTCKGYHRIPNFEFLANFLICDFDFVLLWHGIWYESIVWVIMGQRGVLSECRHSSCSS